MSLQENGLLMTNFLSLKVQILPPTIFSNEKRFMLGSSPYLTISPKFASNNISQWKAFHVMFITLSSSLKVYQWKFYFNTQNFSWWNRIFITKVFSQGKMSSWNIKVLSIKFDYFHKEHEIISPLHAPGTPLHRVIERKYWTLVDIVRLMIGFSTLLISV